MELLPVKQTIITLPYPCEDALTLLEAVTYNEKDYTELVVNRYKPKPLVKFRGVIGNKGFLIALKSAYSQNFLPEILGKIENTSNGCIVMVKYDLYKGTKILFWVWSIITMLSFLVFLINGKFTYALLASILFTLNYVITNVNFHMHCRKAQEELLETFEI